MAARHGITQINHHINVQHHRLLISLLSLSPQFPTKEMKELFVKLDLSYDEKSIHDDPKRYNELSFFAVLNQELRRFYIKAMRQVATSYQLAR